MHPGASPTWWRGFIPSSCGKRLGQSVFVENKPGASGIIAIEEMARAKPDGYTIMVGNISTNCLTPVLLAKRMHIDYERDVQIVARLADVAGVLSWPPRRTSRRRRSAKFIAYAKAHPGDVRYATAGVGAYQHVNTEILAKRAGGLDLVHIPFKDGGAGHPARTSPAATPRCRGSTSPIRSA